jgi:hypothetical protein
LTSQDFKKLRSGKKVKDDIDTKPKLKEDEQIDELSNKTYFAAYKAADRKTGSAAIERDGGIKGKHLRTKELAYKGVKRNNAKQMGQQAEDIEQMDEVKLADLPRRKVMGKSYGADYVDPEGADETAADMKKAEPKRKSGPQGTMKRRFNTKSYDKIKGKLKAQY